MASPSEVRAEPEQPAQPTSPCESGCTVLQASCKTGPGLIPYAEQHCHRRWRLSSLRLSRHSHRSAGQAPSGRPPPERPEPRRPAMQASSFARAASEAEPSTSEAFSSSERRVCHDIPEQHAGRALYQPRLLQGQHSVCSAATGQVVARTAAAALSQTRHTCQLHTRGQLTTSCSRLPLSDSGGCRLAVSPKQQHRFLWKV